MARVSRGWWMVVAGLVALIGLGAGLYGIAARSVHRPVAACGDGVATAARLAPHARGGFAALRVAERPGPLPALAFQDGEGRPRTLADFRGRTVLLNLWATWCAPCREEMPALDRLEASLGGPDFVVLAVNIDQRNLDRPRAFLDEIGVRALTYHSDPTVRIFQTLRGAGKAFGMPTTILINPEGCEIANLAGAADWASDEALALVRAALGR